MHGERTRRSGRTPESGAGPRTAGARSDGLRVALLIESDGPGGAEYTILNLAEELRRRGHAVRPVLPSDGCGWLADEFRAREIEPDEFTLRRAVDPRCVAGLHRLLRRRRIDVVHSHEFAMALYGGAAAWLAGRPHVITMHGSDYFARRLRRRAALRWAARRSRRLVAVSGDLRATIEDVLGPPPSPTVIPNGVPLRAGDGETVRRELGIAAGEPLIVAVGNLYPVKGHGVLLEALAGLRHRHPDLAWTAAIAGRGAEARRLRGLARERRLEGRVRFLGFRDDVPDLLAAADIFAMPSLSEGLPLALLEAMGSGSAIVASRVGGIPEAVRSDREGLLVPPDDPAALTAGLHRLLVDRACRGRLGRAAARRMRTRFSLDAMGAAYERLYRAATGAAAGDDEARGGRPADAGARDRGGRDRADRERGRRNGDGRDRDGDDRRRAAVRAAPRSISIHHVIAPARVGGAEAVVRSLAEGQRRMGHDVSVVPVLSTERSRPHILPALERAGVAVHRLVVPRRAYLEERKAVDALWRRTRPDVVHTHGYRPGVVDGGVARALGIPAVATVHGFTGGGLKKWLYEAVHRLALRRFDRVVAVSTPLAGALGRAGVPADRIRVIPNAWDGGPAPPLGRAAARRRLGVPPDRFHIGWVGRLSREKGPDVLLDALRHLPDLPLTASFIGAGPEGPELRARVAADGGRARLHGMVRDAARLMPAFDVFVLSSRTEGTPIVLLEAMAAGVPIVATRVGGVPDVVSCTEAVLVSPEDPRALARAVRTVHGDADAAAARARAASERLDSEFAAGRWLERYDGVYREILDSEPRERCIRMEPC